MKRHIQFVKVMHHGRSFNKEDAEIINALKKEIRRSTYAVINITKQLLENPKAENRRHYLVLKSVAHIAYITACTTQLIDHSSRIKNEVMPRVVSVPARIIKPKARNYAPGSYDYNTTQFLKRFQW